MIMQHLLIDLASNLRKLDITPELEAWLLSEYGWEPCDNMWDAADLIDIAEDCCSRYHSGDLDTTVPDEASLWKERAKSAKFIMKGIIQEKDHLSDECQYLMKLLDEHGIDY